MCRLYAFRANEPTKIECRLVHAQNALLRQSAEESADRRRADAWGIVRYDGAEPSVRRRVNAAFTDAHFSTMAEQVYSKAVVAHVRWRTVGCNSPLNAQPFTHDRWTFAHNGIIPSFTGIRAELEADTERHLQDSRLGDTDSEQFFLWLLSKLKTAGVSSADAEQRPQRAIAIVSGAVSNLASRCADIAPEANAKLNFVLTNGAVLFACRWNNPLYWVERDGVSVCNVCGTSHIKHDQQTRYRAVAIAAEPITREACHTLPNHSLLLVTPELRCHVEPIEVRLHARPNESRHYQGSPMEAQS